MITRLSISVLVLCAASQLFTDRPRAAAQRVFLGGGIDVGSVPRALEPLCRYARRLKGVGLTGRAGFDAGPVRLGATIDHIARIGVRDMAGCVPNSGIVVDSVFEPADNSSTSLGISALVPIASVLRIGAETGRVLDTEAWYVGPVVGAQYRWLLLEVAARRHSTPFDEVTRNYASGNTREVSRRSRSEGSWGVVTRLLLLTR